jgi:MFS family permease
MTVEEQDESAPPVQLLRGGRWPATAVFLLNGMALSTYIVRVPSLKAEHSLSDGQLGLVGMLFALAALAPMQTVGPLVSRLGTGPVLRTSLVVMPVLLAAVGFAAGRVVFTVAVAALGAVHGTTDAAMNASAVTVERLIGRPVLSGCHAAWSASAVLASLIAAALVAAGVGPGTHFLIVAAVLLVAGLALGPLLLAPQADRGPAGGTGHAGDGWRRGWSGPLLALGVTGTVLMVCEGAALGWGAVFLHDSRGFSLTLAAATVTAYTGGQTAGRTLGDRLTRRYGPSRVFRTGGVTGAVGLALAVAAPQPALAVVGFGVMGVGTSVLIPLAFSAAGHAGGGGSGTAAAVSRFTTFAYAGILLGPALIGWAAELVGLARVLAALVPLLLLVALVCALPGSRRSGASAAGAMPESGRGKVG